MEIKQPGIEEQLAACVRKMDAVGSVMAWSFFPGALEGMRRAEPAIPCGLLIAPDAVPRWQEIRTGAVRLGLQAVSVFFAGVDERLTRDCQLSGLSLYTWTADPEPEIARLIEIGVDGICTNYPDRAVKLLQQATR
jgi:glycerophosphoryl diester phosphodiesterase